MKIDNSKSVWYERYKPQCVDDVILPQDIKERLQTFMKDDNLPNLGFWSPEPGLGKSSTANAIIRQLHCDAMWINASLENGIDTLRNKIAKFASQQSFDGGYKIVVMDECDSMSAQNMAGFRAFLDEFSQNCRFIFTGNYKEKIIQPLLDRLINIDFNTFDKKQMVVPIFERLKYILENENIQYSKDDIKKVILTYYPRIRSMVGALQRYSIDGVLKISEDQLNDLSEFDKIMQFVSAKDYQNMIQGVNALTSPENMYSFLYKHAEKYFNSKYPTAIVTIARYQFMSSSVRDKALNLSACLTELMNL